MKLSFLVALVGFGLFVGCEEHSAPTEPGKEGQAAPTDQAAPAAAPAAEEKPAEAPAAVDEKPAIVAACGAMIEASKSKDMAKLTAMSTDGLGDALKAKPAKKAFLGFFGGASCGEAMVEGTNAKITASSGKMSHEVPFVKQGDAWKFDHQAYMAAAHAEKGGKKDKAAKKGKKNKKKS